MELQSIQGLKEFLNEKGITNKSWVSQSGKNLGGKDFSTSTLS